MTGVEIAVIAGTAITVGDVALAVGTLVSVAGAISQGQQQKRIERQNAAIAQRNARLARAKGDFDANERRRRVSAILGAQRAATGAAGLRLEGSPLLFQSETAREGEFLALTDIFAAENAAAGFAGQAGVADARGGAAATAGVITGGSRLLTGGVRIGDRIQRRNSGVAAEPDDFLDAI